MSQYEEWHFIKDGTLYHHIENDGFRALRHGVQPHTIALCTVAEAETRYPDELREALIRETEPINIKGYSYGLCE
jgi:hypothetical protein